MNSDEARLRNAIDMMNKYAGSEEYLKRATETLVQIEQRRLQQETIARMATGSFNEKWEQALNEFGMGSRPTAGPEPSPHAVKMATKPKEPPSIWKEAKAEVPSDWVPFSEVFGFPPPSGNDRKGPVYKPESFPAELRSFIPTKEHGYFMPPQHTEALWNAHIDKDVVWLHGLSGTGKSSLEEQFAAHIGQPFLRFNGREDIESSALFGQLTVEGGEHGGTVWKDGLLTEGVRFGARVLLDEATVIPAGIMMGVQWLLERGGKLMLTDKPATAGERLVEPDQRFRLTFADNTRGQGDQSGGFNGTGIMNTATLNRVGLTLEIDYLTPDQEFTVLKAKFGDKVDGRVLRDMTQLAGNLRRAMKENQISLAFSLRSITSVLNKAYNYRTLPPREALFRGFQEGYANLLPNEEEEGAAHEFFNLSFAGY